MDMTRPTPHPDTTIAPPIPLDMPDIRLTIPLVVTGIPHTGTITIPVPGVRDLSLDLVRVLLIPIIVMTILVLVLAPIHVTALYLALALDPALALCLGLVLDHIPLHHLATLLIDITTILHVRVEVVFPHPLLIIAQLGEGTLQVQLTLGYLTLRKILKRSFRLL